VSSNPKILPWENRIKCQNLNLKAILNLMMRMKTQIARIREMITNKKTHSGCTEAKV
jgi:hypothetical protein